MIERMNYHQAAKTSNVEALNAFLNMHDDNDEDDIFADIENNSIAMHSYKTCQHYNHQKVPLTEDQKKQESLKRLYRLAAKHLSPQQKEAYLRKFHANESKAPQRNKVLSKGQRSKRQFKEKNNAHSPSPKSVAEPIVTHGPIKNLTDKFAHFFSCSDQTVEDTNVEVNKEKILTELRRDFCFCDFEDSDSFYEDNSIIVRSDRLDTNALRSSSNRHDQKSLDNSSSQKKKQTSSETGIIHSSQLQEAPKFYSILASVISEDINCSAREPCQERADDSKCVNLVSLHHNESTHYYNADSDAITSNQGNDDKFQFKESGVKGSDVVNSFDMSSEFNESLAAKIQFEEAAHRRKIGLKESDVVKSSDLSSRYPHEASIEFNESLAPKLQFGEAGNRRSNGVMESDVVKSSDLSSRYSHEASIQFNKSLAPKKARNFDAYKPTQITSPQTSDDGERFRLISAPQLHIDDKSECPFDEHAKLKAERLNAYFDASKNLPFDEGGFPFAFDEIDIVDKFLDTSFEADSASIPHLCGTSYSYKDTLALRSGLTVDEFVLDVEYQYNKLLKSPYRP